MLIVTCLLASKLRCPDRVPAPGVPLDSRLLPNTASLVWHRFSSAQCQPHDLPNVVYEQSATIEGSSSASLTSLNSCRNINLFERICPLQGVNRNRTRFIGCRLMCPSPFNYQSTPILGGERKQHKRVRHAQPNKHNGVLVSFRPLSSPAIQCILEEVSKALGSCSRSS